MASSKEQLLQSAEKFLAKGKLEPALKEYLRLLDDNPKDVATLNRVGDLYVRMNRPADSIQYYTRIADSYSRDGFFLKAIAIFKKINKIDPARLDIYEKLADLYHKQGLTQDARSQYQVLADHYQKGGKHEDAISAYKKMAGVDPNDLKIQVRLADLYRSHHQTEQAVMQYGLIGSMLLRRGAHDEAAAVFQKALELSPNDANIQKSLVRSLLAQKNAPAAIAILKAAPRTSDSLALLAEAQLDLGNKPDAIKTAEQAIALDARHEGSRTLLCRIRLLEGSFDHAYASIAPAVDAALAGKDFPRAAGFLAPILEAEPAHRQSLEKMAEVREGEGNAAEAASLRVTLGRDAERRADTAAALENYQRALKSQPGNPEALERVRHLGPAGGEEAAQAPAAPRPSEKPREAPAAFGVQEMVIDIEPPARSTAPPFADLVEAKPPAEIVSPAPASAPASASTRPPPPAPPSRPPAGAGEPAARPSGILEEQEIETLVVEAEVFAKYGLADKAVERLRSLVRRRPDLTHARERLVDLMAESKNSALPQEAQGLADLYRKAGREGDAEALLARLGLAAAAAPAPAAAEGPQGAGRPAATTAPELSFDEFEIDLASAAAAPEPAPQTPPPSQAPALGLPGEVDEDSIRFSRSDLEPVQPVRDSGAAAGPSVPIVPAPPVAGTDSDFVSYEELGSLLQDEMQKAGDSPRPAPPPPAVDDTSLFADEQQFFNLAEELEKELAEEIPPPVEAPAMTGPEGEASLEEIFREFKKGVEQQLSAEDYETHFNLGIAYKEMGLIDEAIGEFQLASKDASRTVECCSMLGLCFLEKGMPQLAIKWYTRGLEAPDIKEVETVGLLYDLGGVYQSTGEMELAYKTFLEVYGLNTNYRDIVHRVKELEAVKGN
jgi:tetratricopeptide (TPR) repeat protein